ncbi:MAG: YncE family protein [Acidiferrobacteraceae bacterium]
MRRSIIGVMTQALGALTLAFSVSTASYAAPATLPLRVAHRDVPLGGKADRFDYESVDPRRHLLFIAHLGSSLVTVFDLQTNGVATNIAHVPGVHGVLAVPQLGDVFATATDRNALYVISERTFHIKAKVPAGVYPDGMAYDPVEHKVFISDEAGQTETVVDARTNRRIATISMGGEVGNSQYDPASGLVLVDVQTRDEVVAINPRTDRIVHRYRLPSVCNDDHGLLLDTPAHLAFVACDGNAKLLVVDLRTMHVLSVHTTGKGPDVLAFDAGLHRLYVGSESGVVTVFRLQGQDLRLMGRAYLAFEAHSVAVDPVTHRVYFPLQNVGGVGVLRIMAPTLP